MKLLAILVLFFFGVAFAQVTLSSKKVYQLYETFTVDWTDSCACHDVDDDITITANGAGTYYHSHGVETTASSGTVVLDSVSMPGPYYYSYWRSDGTLATTFNISVVANYTISAPATVVLGEVFTINFTCSPFLDLHVDDGIYLYWAGTTDYINGYREHFPIHLYAVNGSGSMNFTAWDDQLPTMFLRYVLDADPTGNYSNVPFIRTLSGVTMRPRQPVFGLSDNITIDYTAPASHSANDYIYLYKGNFDPSNNNYLKYTLIPAGSTSGSIIFTGFTQTSDFGNYSVAYAAHDQTVVANGNFTIAATGTNTATMSSTAAATTTSAAASVVPAAILLLSVLALFAL